MSDHRPDGRRPLIWIVDDSATEAAFTQHALGAGYDFERFADGSVVVERLVRTHDRPDLMLLDWVMPGMTGDEVCRFLRKQARTSDLPIIIVTASRIETEDVVAGLMAGANDYLPRPFASEELRARVESALRAKALTDSLLRERRRLDAVNRLASGLFRAGSSAGAIVERLAEALSANLCDGCAIMLLPGAAAVAPVARHRHDASATLMAAIGALADPVVHAFADAAEARASLPPQYGEYIDRFGLRGLAIVPFPTRVPLQGVVTLTRDGGSDPFDADDLLAIETAIEYAALAIDTGMRHDAERVGRAQLTAVLSNLPVGIVVTDARGAVTLVNGAAVELVPAIERAGHLSEIYPLAHWAAVGGGELAEADWVIGRALDSQLATRTELVVTPRGEATSRVLSISIVPLLDGHNHLIGSVTVLQDVSAERAVEAERERIARFQEEMLAVVGHDLRNPLGAIQVGLDMLEHASTDRAAVELIHRIGTSTRRMGAMVDRLLDMTSARLGGGVSIQRSEVALLEVIDDVLAEVALAYPRRQFHLVARVAVAGQWDPGRLEQVLSNLLGNAAQHGHPEGVVTLEVQRREGSVAILVRNRNRDQPIPPALLPVMFDPYRRGAHSETGSRSRSLGLGLYIVSEIVRAHGGRIAVTSTHEGTVFEVVLPLG